MIVNGGPVGCKHHILVSKKCEEVENQGVVDQMCPFPDAFREEKRKKKKNFPNTPLLSQTKKEFP